MKFCTALLVCITVSFFSFSQSIPNNPNVTDAKGLRQGKWTLAFDTGWNPVSDMSKAAYYRLIEYKDDKPVGIVRDYYASGKLQWEGGLSADRPQEINHGKATWYRPDGTKDFTRVFDNGKMTEETYFNLDGSVAKESSSQLNSLALTEYSNGNYELAIKYLVKAAGLTEKQYGSEHLDYAMVITNLALAYEKMDKDSLAEVLHRKALKIREKQLGTNDPMYASTLNSIGRILKNKGDLAGAKVLQLKALRIQEATEGRGGKEYVETLTGLAILYNEMSRLDSAELLYIQVLDARRKLYGEVSRDYARALNNLAFFYSESGPLTKSDSLYKKVIELEKKLGIEKHPSYGVTLLNYGILKSTMGDYAGALLYSEGALQVFQHSVGKENLNYASALNSLGEAHRDLENFELAEKYHLESLAIRGRVAGKQHFDYAVSLNNLALLYSDLGNYRLTEQYYSEGLSIVSSVYGAQSGIALHFKNNLASLYWKMGDMSRTEEMLREILEKRAELLGKKHPDYATSVNNLGLACAENGKYKEAEALFHQSIRIYEEIYGKDHVMVAHSLGNLANLYLDTDRIQLAESLMMQVVAIKRKLGEANSDYASALTNYGFTTLFRGKFEKSDSLFERSSQIIASTLGKQHPNYASPLSGRAVANFRSKNFRQAETYFDEVIKNKLYQIDRYFPHLSEKERENFYKSLTYDFEVFNSFAVERYEEDESVTVNMYENQIATKALLFNSNQKISRAIQNSNDSSLIQQYRELQSKRNALVKAYQTPGSEDKSHAVIEKLETEVNTLEKQISSKSLIFLKGNDNKRYSFRDIQAKLKKNEAAVEIIRFRKYGIPRLVTDTGSQAKSIYALLGLTDTVYYAALVVTKKYNSPKLIVLKNGLELESQKLALYRNKMRFKLEDKESYPAYWLPIDRLLKQQKIKKAYVSPDGVYNLINIDALDHSVENEKSKIQIHILTNTKELMTLRSSAKDDFKKSFILFGHPTYLDSQDLDNEENKRDIDLPKSQIERMFEGGRIPALPGTLTEVNAIKNMLEMKGVNTTLYTDFQASEDHLKNLNQPDVVHIATHGYFLENVQKADDRSFGGIEFKRLAMNPLLKSGLLLSGSQQTLEGRISTTREDGILTAFEAMNLALDNTNLVVLSACETGLGEIRNGEGVYGLQRAFQTAGAKSILMSLWKVDDKATQELMTSFYHNWLKSGDKREAFREAQAAIRAKYKHPYYWGAFVLVGE